MKSRARDRRATIRRATATKDRFNAEVQTWSDLVTVSASKEDVKDGERVRAQQVGADITARFGLAWSSVLATVSATDLLICEGRTYAISAVKEIGRREGIEISATALADGPLA